MTKKKTWQVKVSSVKRCCLFVCFTKNARQQENKNYKENEKSGGWGRGEKKQGKISDMIQSENALYQREIWR
jgi:hypothetical protein